MVIIMEKMKKYIIIDEKESYDAEVLKFVREITEGFFGLGYTKMEKTLINEWEGVLNLGFLYNYTFFNDDCKILEVRVSLNYDEGMCHISLSVN